MKRMKKFNSGALLIGLLLIPTLSSCLDDDNDRYHGYYDSLLSIATIQVNDGKDYFFSLDDGKTLLPGDTLSIHNYQVKHGQRVFVYYNILEENKSRYDYNGKIYLIENILTKPVYNMPAEKEDSIGDDRINLLASRLSNGHITMQFQYYGSGDPDKPHMLNLVNNLDAENPQGDYIDLEFRHNAFDDAPLNMGWGYVSFKINEDDTHIVYKGYRIRVNTLYDGVKYYTLDFKNVPRTGGVDSFKDMDDTEKMVAM